MGIKKWIMPQGHESDIHALMDETSLPELCCSVLHARGCRTKADIDAFTAGAPLSDPFALADMDKAVERIRAALATEERIAVYGDYDCDGVTATALLISYLQSVGADAFYYIPGREREGYGLNNGAVDFIREQGAGLIITVDNGISASGEIAYAKSLGIDVVVTDHHMPHGTLPEAVAVVDAHRTDCTSGLTEMAGVGIAFKLICALEGGGEDMLDCYADLVALGIIGDVVPLTGENRTIVRYGLDLLSETARPGLQALLEVSGISGKVSCESVTYGLVPRINAAGRMDSVDDAVELLLTDDVRNAYELAQAVDEHNRQRKRIEAEISAEIDGILAKNPQILNERLLIVQGSNWHHGVVGIVASKVLEKYGLPTILLSVENGVARGSGRSIEGFSLIDAISACSEHLTQYGGHTLAAGMTLPAGKVGEFAAGLQAYAQEKHAAMPMSAYTIDCAVNPAAISVEAVRSLSLLEPFGQGNRPPLILIQDLLVEGVYPTAGGEHIRIRLAKDGASFYAIYFRMSEEEFPYHAGDRVDVVANIGAGEYNGKAQISVKIKDLRMSGAPQEEILAQNEWYARFSAGEIRCAKELLLPQREDLAVLYKYIRAAGGFRHGAVELFYRLMRTGISFARMRVALDVFEEMGLIERAGRSEQAAIRVLPVADKVDIEQSKILMSLRV